MSDPDLSLYRPNVGVVLFNRDGLVWLGRRVSTSDPFNWQFPQGGVDDGEDWDTAARRELWEETGARSVEKLGETQDWIVYDFPPEAQGKKIAKGWRGQKQKWLAFRFTGEDSEFDLQAHPAPGVRPLALGAAGRGARHGRPLQARRLRPGDRGLPDVRRTRVSSATRLSDPP